MTSENKKQIIIITGTRATYGLWHPIIVEFLKSNVFYPRVLATGMHTLTKYGYTLDEIRKDNIPIAAVVPVEENDDMLECFMKEVGGIRNYCLHNRVDAIGVLGDRDEELAGAIVGGHMKIPIFHIAGGDVTGPVIDEPIRHSVTHFSHLHFTACQTSYQRVLRLGEEEWRIFNVGAPGLAGLFEKNYSARSELAKKYALNPHLSWLLVVHHPTPLDTVSFLGQVRPLFQFLGSFDAEKIVIYPNSDTGSNVFVQEIEQYRGLKGFHIIKSLNRDDYLAFMKNTNVLMGNSSSGIVESTVFKTPTVNIGKRQGNRDRGSNVINCDYDSVSIKEATEKARSDEFIQLCRVAQSPYGDGKTATNIVRILEKNIDHPDLLVKKIFHDTNRV